MKTLKSILAGLLIVTSTLAVGSNIPTENKDEKEMDSKAIASVSLNGKVVDVKTGEALAGVALNIEGTSLTAYTDFEGNFEFSNITPGSLNIVASFISYEKTLINLNATEPCKVNVTLKALE